eukprot:XP_028338758.1 cancer/testis antigen 1-like [Physeter catodon]
MDAQVAHQLLTVYFPVPEPMQEELNVEGRVLVIRLTAEDLGHLRASVTFCLSQLSQVVQILRRLVPPFYAQPHQATGG